VKPADRAQRLMDDLAFASRADALTLLEQTFEEAEEVSTRLEREACAVVAHYHGNYLVVEAIRARGR